MAAVRANARRPLMSAAVAGLVSVATNFSRTIPVLVGDTGLVLTSSHDGWGKTR